MAEKEAKKVAGNPVMTATLLMNAFGKYGQTSFQKRIDDSITEVKEIMKDSSPIKVHDSYSYQKDKEGKLVCDSFGNKVTAVGNDDRIKQFDRYTFQNNTLNYRLWTALYNDSWVFQRAINKPAQDMVKLGITVKLDDADKKKEVEELIIKHSPSMTKTFKWGALYGGSVAVCLFDSLSKEDYALPITDKSIKDKLLQAKVMRMYVTDRWYGMSTNTTEVVTDMNDIDYGKPEEYQIMFANGQTWTVHHSWIVRYEHLNAPQLIEKGQLMGWGYAEGAHILNELMRDEELKGAIQSLVNKSLIEVIKMDGMRGLFMGSDDESVKQLQQRLEMVNWARSYNSLTFLDSQDEYTMNGFGGLGGLADLLSTNMWAIEAALEMQGILFGDHKSGMGADTKALERYDDVIQGRADSLARPCYEKFLWIVYQWKGITEKIDFEFGSLLVKEKQAKKEEKVDKHIDRLNKLLETGLISITQYGKSLKKYLEDETLDFGITDESLQQAEQRAKEEAEQGIPLE